MWEVKCTLCELVDMTCFASLKAQTIAQRSYVMFFSRHFTDDTGLMHFLLFHFADDMGVCVFFAYVRLLPCHLQLLYIYIYDYYYIKNYMYYYIFIYLIVFIEWASAQVPPTPLYLGGTVGRERERQRGRGRGRDGWMDG